MGRPTKYPDAFRRDAVELVQSSGRSIAEVARSLGVNEGTLWNWVKLSKVATARAADPDGLAESERDELRGCARRSSSFAQTKRFFAGRRHISPGRRCGDRLAFRPRQHGRSVGGADLPMGGGAAFVVLRVAQPRAIGA